MYHIRIMHVIQPNATHVNTFKNHPDKHIHILSTIQAYYIYITNIQPLYLYLLYVIIILVLVSHTNTLA